MVFGWKLFVRIPNSPTLDLEEGDVNQNLVFQYFPTYYRFHVVLSSSREGELILSARDRLA